MQANRYFLLIKATILIYAFAFLLQSCQNNKNITPQKVNETPNKLENSFATNKEDTFVIGDIHIAFHERSNTLSEFRKNPGKFYYSDVERKDFFLLHDPASQDYYLFGAENGGCLTCISHIEFINRNSLTKEILPEEIKDTIKFRPHKIEAVNYKILEYPFLQLGTNMKAITKDLAKNQFKSVSSKSNKFYKKVNDFTIVTVVFYINRVSTISIQLNVDAE